MNHRWTPFSPCRGQRHGGPLRALGAGGGQEPGASGAWDENVASSGRCFGWTIFFYFSIDIGFLMFGPSFIFPYIGNNHPNKIFYFSIDIGLLIIPTKPATRWRFHWYWIWSSYWWSSMDILEIFFGGNNGWTNWWFSMGTFWMGMMMTINDWKAFVFDLDDDHWWSLMIGKIWFR